MLLYFILTLTAYCQLIETGFRNAYYAAEGYVGSRVLETNYSQPLAKTNWTLTGAVDYAGNQWIVDAKQHVLLRISADSLDSNSPSYLQLIAGTWGKSGHYDAENTVALFKAPLGVGLYQKNGIVLYIADTGNNCVRQVNVTSGKTTTIAGNPASSGLLDGDGTEALFRAPSSVGVESSTGRVFVLDNVDVVRMIELTLSGVRQTWAVTTLVRGACRAISGFWVKRLILREVWCQTEWKASLIQGENMKLWEWPEFCVGNIVTCSANYNSLLSN